MNYYEELYGQGMGPAQIRSSIQEGMIDMINNLQGAHQQQVHAQPNMPHSFHPGPNLGAGAPQQRTNMMGPNNPGDVEDIVSDSEDNE